jgi:hypothetical protein
LGYIRGQDCVAIAPHCDAEHGGILGIHGAAGLSMEISTHMIGEEISMLKSTLPSTIYHRRHRLIAIVAHRQIS